MHGVHGGRVKACFLRGYGVSGAQEGDLKRGDGVVFDAGAPDKDEEGGTIYDIKSAKGRSKGDGAVSKLTFGPGQMNLKKIKVGLICPPAHCMDCHVSGSWNKLFPKTRRVSSARSRGSLR